MSYNLGKVVGTDGKGIVNIVKTGREDNVDTYTITYTNGDTSTFTVTNGVDGESAPLISTVTSTDTVHAVTPKGVYDFVNDLIGDAIIYINR